MAANPGVLIQTAFGLSFAATMPKRYQGEKTLSYTVAVFSGYLVSDGLRTQFRILNELNTLNNVKSERFEEYEGMLPSAIESDRILSQLLSFDVSRYVRWSMLLFAKDRSR